MKSTTIYLFLFSLTIFAKSAWSDCPNSADFAPCTCDGEGLNCRLAIDHLEIQQSFKAYLGSPTARAIFIQGTPVTKLTKGMFGRYQIREFYLDLNQISSVEIGTFENSLNLTTILSLYKNQLQSFPYGEIRKFTKLQTLNLAGNLITSIPDYAFGESSTLERVILMFNKITTIGKKAFDGLTKMESLELQYNEISVLGPESMSILNHHPQLNIGLSGNKVSNVSQTAFLKTAPNIILLDGNNMTSFKEDHFKTIINFMSLVNGFISVEGNPFSCVGCEFRWLLKNQAALRVLAGFVCTSGLPLERLTLSAIRCT